jgi:hypothetical protein
MTWATLPDCLHQFEGLTGRAGLVLSKSRLKRSCPRGSCESTLPLLSEHGLPFAAVVGFALAHLAERRIAEVK